MKKNKKGFTLSEIIVVIAILGVVASITTRTMVLNVQKSEMTTRLKIAYNLLTDITERSRIENNGIPQGNDPNGDSEFNKFIKPYLAISKDCGLKGKGCFAGVNGGFYTSQNEPITGTNSFYKVVLKNGMSLAFRACSNCYQSRNIFVVDINGPNRGYSKFGQDVFMFEWVDNTKFSPLSNWKWKEAAEWLHPETAEEDETVSCAYTPQAAPSVAPWVVYCVGRSSNGGWYSNYRNEKLLEHFCVDGDGTTMSVPRGSSCAAWIINNDWKIPKDYPLGQFNTRPDGF